MAYGSVRRRLRLRQHLLPQPEPRVGQHRRHRKIRRPRQGAGVVMRHLRRDPARRIDGGGTASLERRRRPQEVQVVRVVADRIQPLRLALRQVVLVGANRALVGLGRVRVAPDANVDVRRHVDHVSSGRHQRAETIGAALGAIGIVRGLEQMDVIVLRAGMIGVTRDRALQRRRARCAVSGLGVRPSASSPTASCSSARRRRASGRPGRPGNVPRPSASRRRRPDRAPADRRRPRRRSERPAPRSARARAPSRDDARAPAPRWIASYAARPLSSVIGALRFGPSASAWPQYAIASAGSSRAASRNARIASGVVERVEQPHALIEEPLGLRRRRVTRARAASPGRSARVQVPRRRG